MFLSKKNQIQLDKDENDDEDEEDEEDEGGATKQKTRRKKKKKKQEKGAYLSINEGLQLSSLSSVKTERDDVLHHPVMFMTSYRKKTTQLVASDMKSVKSIVRSLSKHTNFNLRLPTITTNRELYEHCLDTKTAGGDACVVVRF